MPDQLDGQVALVTGGGRGIGANIARELASAGARVADIAGASRVAAGLWFGVERFSPAERAALWAYFTNLDR